MTNFVKKLRAKGWTAQKLAIRWGISPRRISQIGNNPQKKDYDALNGLPEVYEMKKVLFVATDCGNPIRSGYEAAKQWADNNGPEGWYITSHRIGTRTNAYQEQEDTFAYEVCIDEE